MGPNRLWHYTTGIQLLDIIADGRIVRFTLDPAPPVVWFTTHGPSTVRVPLIGSDGTVHILTFEEAARVFGALVRLEVPIGRFPHTVADHRRLALDPQIADMLDKVGKDNGTDPTQRRVSYHDVPIAEVLSIEASDDGLTWVEVGTRNGGGGFQLESGFEARILKAKSRLAIREATDDVGSFETRPPARRPTRH